MKKKYTTKKKYQTGGENKDAAYKYMSDLITKLYNENNDSTFGPINQSGENEYQFNQYTPTGDMQFNDGFKAFNTVAQGVTGASNYIQDLKQRKQENDQYIKALQPRATINPDSNGVNNIPIYKNGGRDIKPSKAREILHDGTAHGKKLTDKQRKFFGAMSKMKPGGKNDWHHNVDDIPFPQNNGPMGPPSFDSWNASQNGWQQDATPGARYTINPMIADPNRTQAIQSPRGVWLQMPNQAPSQQQATPQQQAPIAPVYSEDNVPQSFGQAFKKARKELGSGKIFTYKGKKYTTNYAGENIKGSSTSSKQASTQSAKQPIVNPENINPNSFIKREYNDIWNNPNGSSSIDDLDMEDLDWTYYDNNRANVDDDRLYNPDLKWRQSIATQAGDPYFKTPEGKLANISPVTAEKLKKLTGIDVWKFSGDLYNKKYDNMASSFESKGTVPKGIQEAAKMSGFDLQKYINERRDILNRDMRRKKQNGGDNEADETTLDNEQTEDYSPFVKTQEAPLAELEQGEVYQDREGNIDKVSEQGNTHENGGEVIANVDKVLQDTSDKRKDFVSKLLKLTKADVDHLNSQTGYNVKNAKTHSKYFEKVSDIQDKELVKLQKKISDNLDYVNKSNSNFAKNSLALNIKELEKTKTKQELFDKIFNHQELLKGDLSPENYAKNGGIIKYQPGGRPGKTTYDNVDYNQYDPQAQQELGYFYNFAKQQGYEGKPDDIKGIQDYVFNKKFPNIATDYASNDEMTNYGRSLYGDKSMKDLTPEEQRNQLVDGKFWRRYFTTQDKSFSNKDDYNSFIQGKRKVTENGVDYYVDPSTDKTTASTYYNPSYSPQQELNFTDTHTPSNNNSKLDPRAIGVDLYNLIDSGRLPVRYDSPTLRTPTIHLDDYRPSLNEGNMDYNAALKMLPQTGMGNANAANLFATKYNIDNQIIGNTVGRNNQKLDALDNQIAQTQNAQSMYDMNARRDFDMRWKKSLENQRLQRLTALDDISTKYQQNDAFNRNKDLILQMSPYFNDRGQYTGKQYQFNTTYANAPQSGLTHLTGNYFRDTKGNTFLFDPKTGTHQKVNP